MTQVRSKNLSIIGEEGDHKHAQNPLLKMSGKDKMPATKKKSNKVPKNLRYDLETALLGLCDLWFDEIKPHLVRNNIKLHVNESEDIPKGLTNQNQTECSHCEPGAPTDQKRRPDANCACYCLTQRPASRAPCLRRPVPAPIPASHLLYRIQSNMKPAPKETPSSLHPQKRVTLTSPTMILLNRPLKETSVPKVNLNNNEHHKSEANVASRLKINHGQGDNRCNKLSKTESKESKRCHTKEKTGLHYSVDLINMFVNYNKRIKQIRKKTGSRNLSDKSALTLLTNIDLKNKKKTRRKKSRIIRPPWK